MHVTNIRNTMKSHPSLTLLALVAVAWLSLPLAGLLLFAALAILAGPALVKQVNLIEHHARSQALQHIQRTGAVGADLIQLERWRATEQQKADTWEARAQKAMIAGDEASALACLERKRAHVARIGELDHELAKQRPIVAGMNDVVNKQLGAARELRQQGRAQGLHLVIQKRRVDARRGLVMARAGLSEDGDRLAGMAERIQREEDEIDAMEQAIGEERDEVAASYEAAERSERERADLEALRQRVGMGRPALGARSG